jgi:hypothetical protein
MVVFLSHYLGELAVEELHCNMTELIMGKKEMGLNLFYNDDVVCLYIVAERPRPGKNEKTARSVYGYDVLLRVGDGGGGPVGRMGW